MSPRGPPYSVGFWRLLASGGEDGIVRLWIAQREVLANLVKQKLERRLTAKEWSRFIGEGFEDEFLETPFAARLVS
jgi:hypothetical protein